MFKKAINFFQNRGFELINNDEYQQDLVNEDNTITIMKIEGEVVCNKYKKLKNNKYKFISETHIENDQELDNILNG